MNWSLLIFLILIAWLLGLGVAYFLFLRSGRKEEEIKALVEILKSQVGIVSMEVVSKSTDELLKLAKEKLEAERALTAKELENKKSLIDQQLQHLNNNLTEVSKLIKELERDRQLKFGEVSKQIEETNKQTLALAQITNSLREALASTKVRGQWGERMAEDILRLMGMKENVNYFKQKLVEEGSSRPDFTFLLPNDLKLNMDVKFPLENYLKYLNSQSEVEKEKFKCDFLRDVRKKIREVTSREYIDRKSTVDCVLLFIPNEQIYAFIHEQDSTIIEEGIKNKVVFCSPVTLFAVLAVIRQAVDNFALERTSNKILELLASFRKQWGMFVEKLEKLGESIEKSHRYYEELVTTRRRQLEKPLSEIDGLQLASTSEELSRALIVDGEVVKEENEES